MIEQGYKLEWVDDPAVLVCQDNKPTLHQVTYLSNIRVRISSECSTNVHEVQQYQFGEYVTISVSKSKVAAQRKAIRHTIKLLKELNRRFVSDIPEKENANAK